MKKLSNPKGQTTIYKYDFILPEPYDYWCINRDYVFVTELPYLLKDDDVVFIPFELKDAFKRNKGEMSSDYNYSKSQLLNIALNNAYRECISNSRLKVKNIIYKSDIIEAELNPVDIINLEKNISNSVFFELCRLDNSFDDIKERVIEEQKAFNKTADYNEKEYYNMFDKGFLKDVLESFRRSKENSDIILRSINKHVSNGKKPFHEYYHEGILEMARRERLRWDSIIKRSEIFYKPLDNEDVEF